METKEYENEKSVMTTALTRKDYLLRLFRLFFGLFVLANGSVLSVQSGVGGNPWLVLNTGMNHTFGISIGTSSILFGCLFVLISYLCRVQVGLGTVVNMVMAGVFTDLVLLLDYIPRAATFSGGMAMLLCGCVIFLYGTYLYLSSRFGSGPRDGIMVVLARAIRLPIGVSREIIEALAVFSGFLLGGVIGWGTLVSVLVNGPILQLICLVHHFDPKLTQHESLQESLQNLRCLFFTDRKSNQ